MGGRQEKGGQGGKGREYFCMLYEARRHMPSELGCLLSQGSWVDRPVLAPSLPPKLPPLHQTNTPVMGQAIALVVHGLSCVFVSVLEVCMRVCGGGTQWSEHIGHCHESRQEQLVSWREEWEGVVIRREKRWEAVRNTDNGIRLKHSGVGETPPLAPVFSNTL